MEERKYVLSLIVQNKTGVFSRISGLLTRRGFNIDSISAAVTETDDISLIVIEFKASEKAANQIKKQLEKQYDVYQIKELKSPDAVTREHIMIKLKAAPDERHSIVSVASIFRASVVDVSPRTMIVELTGESSKTNAFIEAVKPYGIIQVVRSGVVGMERSGETPFKETL